MVNVFGHRGASAHAPENTVEAFRLAVELGADWVELDVRVTADDALAVHHDELLPDGRPVAAVVAADLPAHVCLLDAALDACGPMGVNVEIKSAPLAPTLAVIRAWGGEVIVSSFDAAVVDEVRELDADMPTGQLTTLLDREPAALAAWIVERGHGWWHPWQPVLEAAAVVEAKAAGLGVNTWTADDPARIAELASWGVDGIVTNDIPTALAALGR